MFASDYSQPDRLPVIVQPPSPASPGIFYIHPSSLHCLAHRNVILDQTIHGGNTPVPFVNNAALDEVKDSIQELRSILLRGRRGPYEEPYYAVEMDDGVGALETLVALVRRHLKPTTTMAQSFFQLAKIIIHRQELHRFRGNRFRETNILVKLSNCRVPEQLRL